MEYTAIESMKIPRLTLGTAQLGLKYGIANKAGKPDRQKAREILRYAAESGINCFDTAPAYGESEKITGDFLASYREFPAESVIVTKLAPINPGGKPDSKKVYGLIRQQAMKSLGRLKLKKIPVYLLHNFSDLDKYGGLISEGLLKLRDEGLIGIPGASTYEPEEVDRFLKTDGMKAIQVPINIFDQRLIKEGQLTRLKEKGCIVFARSVFLQGLFFLDTDNLPSFLAPAGAYLKQLHRLASENNMSIAQLALTFVRDLPGITSTVIGAESIEQVRQNIELMQSPPMSDKLRDEIMAIFADVPREITDPRTWEPEKQGAIK
jgi:aryl-alcohol dehydrogenase-like predicted oxidoreductase